MSKAFTHEDAQLPPSAPERPISTREAPITPSGLRALQAELRALEAGPPGEAEADRRRRERRVLELTTRLRCVHSVDLSGSDPGRALFGATVELEDEDGVVRTYQLVGPDEVDPARGWISVEAPLGRALLAREVGDTVTVERPKGAVELTLMSIRYDPQV